MAPRARQAEAAAIGQPLRGECARPRTPRRFERPAPALAADGKPFVPPYSVQRGPRHAASRLAAPAPLGMVRPAATPSSSTHAARVRAPAAVSSNSGCDGQHPPCAREFGARCRADAVHRTAPPTTRAARAAPRRGPRRVTSCRAPPWQHAAPELRASNSPTRQGGPRQASALHRADAHRAELHNEVAQRAARGLHSHCGASALHDVVQH